MRGIGGSGTILGQALIQIRPKGLRLINDITFSILKDNFSSPLFNRDILVNELDSLLKGHYMHVGRHYQPLYLENFFFVHRYFSDDIPFALYTERDLRRIHRGSRHQSVRSTHKFLQRAGEDLIEKDTRNGLKTLRADFGTCKKIGEAPRRFKLTIGTEGIQFN